VPTSRMASSDDTSDDHLEYRWRASTVSNVKLWMLNVLYPSQQARWKTYRYIRTV